MGALAVRSLAGIPEVQPGDDLARLIHHASPAIAQGAVVAIAHTVVSKSEGAVVSLSGVRPGARALRLAAEHGKDPRVVQVVLDESAEVLRVARGVIVSRTRHGFVCANAGVDVSNAGDADTVALLPRDPDSSARAIRARLAELNAAGPPGSPEAAGPPPAVLISDTFGRTWRHGQTDVAIGLAGMRALEDWRGRNDASGTVLRATWIAIADAAAAAADLARAKDSREPVAVIEGLERFVTEDDGPGAAALVRPAEEDLFH